MNRGDLNFEKSKAFTAQLEHLVPGGAHTYSKGRDQFPENAPNGITHGQGARVWDADNNEFIDWSMGLTSVSLGHAYPDVDDAVCEAIRRGVNFQRPSALELKAAEMFLSMTGTDMVKFAKHGSSITTAAVKLSRAFTGRTKVAVPREHPFFSFDDWFIGTTDSDYGIPSELKQFSLTFSYNNIDSLYTLFKDHPGEIACVIMEPTKFVAPKDDFLFKVRELCTRNGTILICDEMISGLKIGVPGASAYFGLDADLYTYGKGIANGFSCAALTGRGDIMSLGGIANEGSRKLFLLSTTHGAESTGLAAMIKTVDLFRDGRLVQQNWQVGENLRRQLKEVITNYNLDDYLKINGYPSMMLLETFGPTGLDLSFRTLFMQEMISRGVLFQGLFILTPSHGEKEIAQTVQAFTGACSVYKQALDQGSVESILIGPAIKPVFRKIV
ncbi:MAG: glutamate-1-semialdehyde 2,1-aminomutase [Halopseudomonas aestusnigri]